jgi:ketosteroid isomerase-like protein
MPNSRERLVTTFPVEILRSYLGSVERLDVDACIALFADDAIIRVPLDEPDGMKIVGRLSIESAVRAHFATILRYEWINPVFNATDDPELAVVRCSSRATLKDGRHYSNTYCIFGRACNAKLIETLEYFSPFKAASGFPVTHSASASAMQK